MAPEPDLLAAELAAICDRAEEMRSRDVWVRVAAAEADRDRLLGALGEVLKVHAEFEGRCTACMEFCTCAEDAQATGKVAAPELHKAVYEGWAECAHGNTPWPCPTVQAITSKLLSEGESGG